MANKNVLNSFINSLKEVALLILKGTKKTCTQNIDILIGNF